MPIITDKPVDIPSGNDLDGIQTGDEPTPAAYLRFGSSPCALDNPPEVGEVRTYIVRARCTEEHGPIERKDGEMRFARTLTIQACWQQGQKEPVADDGQGSLFSANGQVEDDGEGDPDEDAADAEDQAGDEPEDESCPDDPADLDKDL
jgi:hypothetical protein